jgi:anion-transporting  ArsA/GET3 family ATPase
VACAGSRAAVVVSDIGKRLDGAKVVICMGAGGVGKTTVSAAIAIGLAAEGRRVALVTIDPARRLAETLGLSALGNRPRQVEPHRFSATGAPLRGELWAMMLDASRTFDEVISRLAPDPSLRDQILANSVYRNLSTAVAGSQEYGAMAKLFEIAGDGAYDTIVLDTPPSRNALDFLDAPGRLSAFLDGRGFALLALPGRRAARAVGALSGALARVLGVSLLRELASFFALIGGLADGFRDRARGVSRLLADPATAFVLVSSPQRAAAEETLFLAGALADADMHCRALIINRIHPSFGARRDPQETVVRLQPKLGARMARKVARTDAEAQAIAREDTRVVDRLRRSLAGVPAACALERDSDVHDIAALVSLARELFARRRR